MLDISRKIRKEEFALFFVSFCAPVFIIRSVLFYFVKNYSVMPSFFVKNFHVHHYFVGLFLILGSLLLYQLNRKKKSVFQIVFLGAGLGLMFDEVSLWVPFLANNEYWALRNFFAVIFLALLLLFLNYKLYKGLYEEARKLSINVFSFIPILVLVSFFFSLFYFADPAVAQATKNNVVVKKITYAKEKIKKENKRVNDFFKKIKIKIKES